MSYSSERIEELRALLHAQAPGIADSRDVEKLVGFEDEMTENKDYLNTLLERNILNSAELGEKLNRCFEVFIVQAAEILGAETCRNIYGFGPGEEIELIPRESIQRANIKSKGAKANLHIHLNSKNVARTSALLGELIEQLTGNTAISVFKATTQKEPSTELWLSALSRGALDATYAILTHWIANRGDVAVVVNPGEENIEFSPEKRMTEETIRTMLESRISNAG